MQRTLDRLTILNHFLVQLSHFKHISRVELGHGLTFSCLLNSHPVQGVALVKSSDYWESRLHLRKEGGPIGLVVCYRHDSVIPCHVLALEDSHEYDKEALPDKYPSIEAVHQEHSRYAAKVFLGALMCGLKSAHDILGNDDVMPESTRRKYEAKMHTYQRRRQGRPLASQKKENP